MKYKNSASAKTILFGEHAVVYGEPAIAIPLINTRTYCEIHPNGKEFRIISENTKLNHTYTKLNPQSGLYNLLSILMDVFSFHELPPDTLSIRSDIPIASGLGSGAAFSIAIIRSFCSYYDKELSNDQINKIAFEIEKIYHGSPSGIDNTTIAYEQAIIFKKDSGFEEIKSDLSFMNLLVIDSGIRSRTIDVVSDVKANFEKNKPFINEIGKLVYSAVSVLEDMNSEEIGLLMNENQRLLCHMNVSSPELDELIDFGRKNHALGGKLTGAGRGGNFLILARDKDQAEWLKKQYELMGLNVIL